MDSMFRFISFQAFVNLVELQKERYVNPCSWEDTWEGFPYRIIEKNNNIAEILMDFLDIHTGSCPETEVNNYFKLYSARWLCYAQCWSTLSESDALWRIYSYDRMAVRIETNINAIEDILSNDTNKNKYYHRIDDVKYDMNTKQKAITYSDLIKKAFDSKNITEPFYHKRDVFEHEKEKRVLLLDNELAGFISSFPAMIVLNDYRIKTKEIEPTTQNKIRILAEEIKKIPHIKSEILNEKIEKSIQLEIPDLTAYIKSVMVHPQAEEWIVRLVKAICERKNLKFVGKSEMYEII